MHEKKAILVPGIGMVSVSSRRVLFDHPPVSTGPLWYRYGTGNGTHMWYT